MRRVRWTCGVVGVATMVLMGWLGSGDGAREAAAQGGKVRVGVVLPLSGQFAVGAVNPKRGYDLAAEEINKAGGIKALGGAQIELVYADNQGKQDVSSD